MSEPAPIPAELRALATAKAAEITQQRISKIEWQGQTVWVKKPVPPKATKWNKLQYFLTLLLRLPILRPTTSPGGAEGLRLEAWRIYELRRAGIPTPEVLGITDDWILLSHLGEQIDRKLQQDKTLQPVDLADIVCDCAEAIAKLHKAGYVHGRPKLNDLILAKDGTIAFVDFEENIDAGGLTLAALQARDVWLFMCSAARFEKRYPNLLDEAYDSYTEANNDAKVQKEMKKLLSVLKPLQYLFWPFHKILGGDFERAFIATTALIRYKKKPVT